MSSLFNYRNEQQIPLVCWVCPRTPGFSDVSHLLTHIASKGHLHHETQTKLRSHQDFTSAIALQQYEQWYQAHGIETLLVERMKAKQAKEETRHKRQRNGKRRKMESVKVEADDYLHGTPIYPDIFESENELDLQEGPFSNETSSLKGQIWPGMGKMDLANEDMRRTRNQRKPKSAIERMRRASESIEPTLVVMNLELEVETIKGVYDPSSPIPEQEEPTPLTRVPKTRKKKTKILQEVSVNIPKQYRRKRSQRVTTNNTTTTAIHIPDLKPLPLPRRITSFSTDSDVFRDENMNMDFSIYDDKSFESHYATSNRLFPYPSHTNMQDIRQVSQHSINDAIELDSVSSSNLPDRSLAYPRRLGLPFFSRESHPYLTDPYIQSDNSFSMSNNTLFSRPGSMLRNEARNSSLQPSNYGPVPNIQGRQRRNEHLISPSPGSNGSFTTFTGSNPLLFSQASTYRRSYCRQSPPNTSSIFSPTAFVSSSRTQTTDTSPSNKPEGLETRNSNNAKIESPLCNPLDVSDDGDMKEPSIYTHNMWNEHASDMENETHEN